MKTLRYFFEALAWAVVVPAAVLSGLACLPFCISPLILMLLPVLAVTWMVAFRWFPAAVARWEKRAADGGIPAGFTLRYLPFFLPMFYTLALAAMCYSRTLHYGADMKTLQLGWLFPYAVYWLGSGFFAPPRVTLLVPVAAAVMMACFGPVYVRRVMKAAGPARRKILGTLLLLTLTAITGWLCWTAYEDYGLRVFREGNHVGMVIPDEPGVREPWWEVIRERRLDAYRPEGERYAGAGVELPAEIFENPPKIRASFPFMPLVMALGEAFYPVPEDMGRTPEVFESLLAGESDMVMMLRPTETQMARAAELGKSLTVTPVAREALVFFVNRQNPVEDMKMSRLLMVYRGKKAHWLYYGGPDVEILAFHRPVGSASWTIMDRAVMKQGEEEPYAPLREEISYKDVFHGVKTANYRNAENALGYSLRIFLTELYPRGWEHPAPLDEVKLLAVDGVAPTVEHIRSGAYPLVEEVVIVTAGSENPHVQSLIDWFLSPQGQELVERVGYVRND